jgi:hypothetical protein
MDWQHEEQKDPGNPPNRGCWKSLDVGKIHTCFPGHSYHFLEYTQVTIPPKEGVPQINSDFGGQIPDFAGVDQFRIPKLCNFKSTFLAQNDNWYLFQAI